MFWGHYGFHPFGWIFALLWIGFLVTWIVSIRRGSWGWCRGNGDETFRPESILKRRLASGEITESEYERLKETLSK